MKNLILLLSVITLTACSGGNSSSGKRKACDSKESCNCLANEPAWTNGHQSCHVPTQWKTKCGDWHATFGTREICYPGTKPPKNNSNHQHIRPDGE